MTIDQDQILQPKLSVIIPNFNNEKHLKTCINSVLNQTYKNIEIIISDDCSTDNSFRIIKEYEAKYPEIILALQNKKNMGISKNRHKAILNSNANYLTTLDSDDYLIDNTKLESEMRLVIDNQNKTDEYIIAYSNIIIKDSNNAFHNQALVKEIKEGSIINEIMTRKSLIPRDFVFPKEAYFEAGGYDEKIEIYEDWDLKIRLAKIAKFLYTGINGVVYRRHGSGLSNAETAKHLYWLNRVFKKNIHLVKPAEKTKTIECFKKMIKPLEHKAKLEHISMIKKNIKTGQVVSLTKSIYEYAKISYFGYY